MIHRPARRQRRIARRRQEILDAAAHLFADQGYAGTTTKEIAAAADVAEGTLYNYFPGKREILLTIAAELQGTMRVLLQDLDQVQERGELVALVRRAYDDLAAKLPFIRSFLTEIWIDDLLLREYALNHVARIAQQVQSFLVRHTEAGLLRPADPVLASRMILGVFTAPIFPALRGLADYPGPKERDALAEAVVDLLMDGLRVRLVEERAC